MKDTIQNNWGENCATCFFETYQECHWSESGYIENGEVDKDINEYNHCRRWQDHKTYKEKGK